MTENLTQWLYRYEEQLTAKLVAFRRNITRLRLVIVPGPTIVALGFTLTTVLFVWWRLETLAVPS